MKYLNLAVLGATGLVGGKILQILEEENFPLSSLKLLASGRSTGKKLSFKGECLPVEEVHPDSFKGVDMVLASAGTDVSRRYAKEAVDRGAVFIDNSNAFRMEGDVPLVVVGVNDEDLRGHRGLISNPNCSTSQLMPVLNALRKISPLKRLIVSTYQAVSGAGAQAVEELSLNTQAFMEKRGFEAAVFKKNIAFNVLPQIDVFCENGYTGEEMKVVRETRKILHLSSDFPITCTAVRVPVFTGHSEVVVIEFEDSVCPQQAVEALSREKEIIVQDSENPFDYPTPFEATEKNPVYVGRIRKDLAFENGLSLWCVADNLRIGAALNTVRIGKKLLEMGLV